MTSTTLENSTTTRSVLYMAMELSQNKWCLAFGNGIKTRQVVINANDQVRLLARKLLIAIWRYLETGEIPKGAKLKQA